MILLTHVASALGYVYSTCYQFDMSRPPVVMLNRWPCITLYSTLMCVRYNYDLAYYPPVELLGNSVLAKTAQYFCSCFKTQIIEA